ncbi:hypothetical protein CDD83_10734 [Cordyceps sp. RAO-2017]|nr:hypothetical protein CDD83_10734 [Cordyceps sp. RAO-2017]
MASRYSAARPKRAGENFARTHHHDRQDDTESGTKRVKFDVRNPSTLAPDAREEDAVLDADVIGGSNATKRGAVNLDGYDSDSDHETFDARAADRGQSNVNISEKLDNYDAGCSRAGGEEAGAGADDRREDDDDDDDDDDMFAEIDEGDTKQESDPNSLHDKRRKRKDFRGFEFSGFKGEESASKSGGRVRLDDRESSDDEDVKEMAIQEEGLDEEVGAGGLKRNAPKIEAFNLREEMDQGQFDEQGNYVRKAEDPDAVHDSWLEGCSKKEMRKAAEAHSKREAEARKQRIEEDGVLVPDLLKALIPQLQRTETPLEALARLGKNQAKTKKIPKWKLKKMNKGAESMDVDPAVPKDAAHTRVKKSIDTITDAADKLLSRDYEDIYDREREMLVREYKRETGEDWVEPEPEPATDEENDEGDKASEAAESWEFRWTDGRDGGATQGPFDRATMKAWEDAGYFEKGVEFRRAGGDWTQAATFT